MPHAAIGAPATRRCPSVARRTDERDHLPKKPRRSQQPDVDVLSFVAAPEIGTSECVRLVKPARAADEARRHDEHGAVSHYPVANRSDVFLLRPYNGPAHQRRRASAQPLVNDTEYSKAWAMSRTVAFPTRYTRSPRAE